jgi:hypothetical protein
MSKRVLKLGDIVEGVILSDEPLESAIEIMIAMMAIAGQLSTEEYVFTRIEELINDARRHNNERHN